jgi:hypothetical protein
MKYYILINPFTNKPIQFSTFKNDDFKVADISIDSNGNRIANTQNALCLETDYDFSLLEKTYDPNTETFN